MKSPEAIEVSILLLARAVASGTKEDKKAITESTTNKEKQLANEEILAAPFHGAALERTVQRRER